MIETAIDVGPSVVPFISRALDSFAESSRSVALTTLAYLGGDEAIEALRHESVIRPSAATWRALCEALPSRGNADDRAFLIDVLEKGFPSHEWRTVQSAVLSIGVLRCSEAMTVLEKTAREAPGIPAHAARVALAWIREGPFAVDVMNLQRSERPILAAVLGHGVPRAEEAREFSDSDRHGSWCRDGRSWSFHPGVQQAGHPSMRFVIHQSPDSLRAVVSAGLSFGPANGIGYDYVLGKDATWKVKGLLFTWIS